MNNEEVEVIEEASLPLKFKETLGKGGFGTVMSAYYKPLHKHVAVKVIT